MKRILIIFAMMMVAGGAGAQESVRLVVNIVASRLRADDLERYYPNLDERGIKRFVNEGTVFADARYDYMLTSTAAGLATLTTGTDPSTHGVVSEFWVDYTTGERVSLIDDYAVQGLSTDAGRGQHSAHNITVPTLADRLKELDPASRTLTVAATPLSAVAMGGLRSPVYWLDEGSGRWVSSTGYMSELPRWVSDYNDMHLAREWLDYVWRPLLGEGIYASSKQLERRVNSYGDMMQTPVGNTLVLEFAKQAIERERLGEDSHVDILNICLDTPEIIGRLHGGQSMEFEDMLYRLDRELADLLSFLDGRDAIVVFTAAHGASDTASDENRFSAAQFKVIMNGFLNAQYGEGDWVADYVDRQLYLNRNLVYQKGLSLEEVQNRAAAFALQFRGVSHVLTSTAMQSSYFGGSYAQRMQNSFYPRRGGDLTLNLMPGWIEEVVGAGSLSGSMYEYDTHVPLMVLGLGQQRVWRTVNLKDLAPTLAQRIKISRPIASDGGTINELL